MFCATKKKNVCSQIHFIHLIYSIENGKMGKCEMFMLSHFHFVDELHEINGKIFCYKQRKIQCNQSGWKWWHWKAK